MCVMMCRNDEIGLIKSIDGLQRESVDINNAFRHLSGEGSRVHRNSHTSNVVYSCGFYHICTMDNTIDG